MDAAEFDAKIADARSIIDGLRCQMDLTTSEFVDRVSDFAIGWLDQAAERAVMANAARAKALGIDGLAQLKAGIEKLKSEMKSLAREEFLQNKYWPHRDQTGIDRIIPSAFVSCGKGCSETPVEFKKGFERLLGNLGKVLIHFGLVRPDDTPRTWLIEGHEVRCLDSWHLGDALINALNRYGALASNHSYAVAALREAEKSKEQAEASDLWRQVSATSQSVA